MLISSLGASWETWWLRVHKEQKNRWEQNHETQHKSIQQKTLVFTCKNVIKQITDGMNVI